MKLEKSRRKPPPPASVQVDEPTDRGDAAEVLTITGDHALADSLVTLFPLPAKLGS